MADPEHVELLRQGAKAWNRWRRAHPRTVPDLAADAVSDFEAAVLALAEVVGHEAMPGKAPKWDGPLAGLEHGSVNLKGANLRRANLSRTMLPLADLRGADLRGANLAGVVLTSAKLGGARLNGANLHSCILRFANMQRADLDDSIMRLTNLDGADLRGASLKKSDLSFASLNEAHLDRADLTGAFVYGASVWNVTVKGATQVDLRITRTHEGIVTVDDLRIAQFLYLLINNDNVRAAIDTITTKVVLILGRFSEERKAVLDQMKARLAIPVKPLLLQGSEPYAMFTDYWKYDWVLEIHRYRNAEDLMSGVRRAVVAPAERKAVELQRRRNAGRK